MNYYIYIYFGNIWILGIFLHKAAKYRGVFSTGYEICWVNHAWFECINVCSK